MDKIIENMYGIGGILSRDDRPDPANQYSNVNYSSGLTRNNNETFGKPSEEFSLEEWQTILKDRIITNKDTFVSVPPSAGKTAPVKRATKQLFLDFFRNKGQLPLMLYVVPRKQLAGQINYNDIQNLFLKIIEEQRSLQPGNPERIESFNRLFTNDTSISIFLSNLVIEIIGGSGSNINTGYSIFNNRYPFIIATYEPAIGIVSKYGNKITHIIVDEVQELVPHPGEGVNEGLMQRYNSLTKILDNATIKSSVSLMTGSINNITVGHLVDYFNKKYNRRFEIVPKFNVNEPRLNRSDIVLQPLQLLSGFPNKSVPKRIALSKDIILNKQSNSIMIIFSKQRSGQGIFRMIEELIKTIPPKSVNTFYDKPTTKNINQIDNTLEDMLKNKLIKSSTEIDDIEYLKYFNITDMFLSKSKSETELLDRRNKDPDNILYQAVLRGFAPLIGSMAQIHKRVIQNLFIKRKIYLLFATDALGVGANVECRHLYIPTVEKFDGKGLSRTDESSLTQLVHRAGRDKQNIPVANVYCSIQDYDYISGLIYNDPRSAVPEINPLILQDLFNVEKKYGESFVKKLFAKALLMRYK